MKKRQLSVVKIYLELVQAIILVAKTQFKHAVWDLPYAKNKINK